MLAQNFKTAAELGITDDDFRGLVTVLGMLEREEIGADDFDMRELCGTTCCLCGWAYNVTNGAAFPEVNAYIRGHAMPTGRYPEELKKLFWLGRSIIDVRSPEPQQAATALRGYLTTGEARWKEALSKQL